MTTDIEPDLSVALLVSQLAVVGDDYGVMCLGCVGFRRLQCAVVHQQIINQQLTTAQHHACTNMYYSHVYKEYFHRWELRVAI